MQDSQNELSTKTGQRTAPGRPRDPHLEARVFQTVMTLYAQGGCQSLTFEAVARDAGVGKAALYRRWPSRGALFADALQENWLSLSSTDTGSLRGDLTALAGMLFEKMSGEFGHTNFFLQADARKFPEVAEAITTYRRELIREAKAIVYRAIERRDLPVGSDASLVMDVIVGAIANHISTTPPEKKDQMIADAPEYLERLIALVMKGLNEVEPK